LSVPEISNVLDLLYFLFRAPIAQLDRAAAF
jgi:hypothetical protein